MVADISGRHAQTFLPYNFGMIQGFGMRVHRHCFRECSHYDMGHSFSNDFEMQNKPNLESVLQLIWQKVSQTLAAIRNTLHILY